MKYIYYLLSAVLLLSACKDVELGPITQEDGTAPAIISDVTVKAIPGGAVITYQLPTDPDLLYVEANYALPNGESKVVTASYNKRSVSVEGFAEVKEYTVSLTSVDRSGNRSTPYMVNFTPDTPPIISILSTLEMQADFGGLHLEWDNPTKAELAILVYRTDSIGDNVMIDTQYSSAANGAYTVRGQDTISTNYSVRLRDKWSNYSEVKSKTLTPIFEVKLDRTKFRALGAEFADRVGTIGNIPRLWDDNFSDNAITDGKTVAPWYASFSIGDVPVRLSRVVVWQYAWANTMNYGHYYAGNNMRRFELWGSNDPTTDMSGWVKLQNSEIIKPSGLPIGVGRDNMSNEDFELAHDKGHEFTIPLDAPAVRYIRLVSLEGFETNDLATPSELHFYGDPR